MVRVRWNYPGDRAAAAPARSVCATALMVWAGLVVADRPAHAICSPPTGDGVAVTCTGTTTDQGPGSNTGYGGGTQTGVTIAVQSGASVTGTSIGVDVGVGNTITNAGTITTGGSGIGNLYAINAAGDLTVVNSGTIGRVDLVIPSNTDQAGINISGGTLVVTNTAAGVIQGVTAIQAAGSPSTMTVSNSGLISGVVGGGGTGIFGDTVNLTNTATGTITADGYAISANTATIENYGTISAAVPGSGGTAISANALTLTNYASGTITADYTAVSGSQSPVLTVTNYGTISATGPGGTAIFGNQVDVTNSGSITGTGSGGAAIFTYTGSVTNTASGVIAGDAQAIASFGDMTVVNAGSITANGVAIQVLGNTTVTNSGTIAGGASFGAGVATIGPLTLTNTATGVISGDYAVSAGDYSTIVNAGTIAGTTFGISAGTGTSIYNSGTITGGFAAIEFCGCSSGGTLTLAPTSVIVGSVLGTGSQTLRLGGSGIGTFDAGLIGVGAQYDGFGTFAKVGASTWTLTGTNAAALPWTVQQGTLIVAGTLAASPFTVQGGTLVVNGTVGAVTLDGGALGGSGTVGTTAITNGTLSPGNSIGTITIAGNLTLGSGSTYLVEVSPSAADRTNVAGTATLAGTVQAVFSPGAYVPRSYTILHADGGRSGTFGSLITNNLPAFFAASLGYTPTDVSLTLTLNLGGAPGFNTNQHAVGVALDRVFNSGAGMSGAFSALLLSSAVPGGLTQLSGEIGTGAAQAAFRQTDQFLELMLDPFAGGRATGAGGVGPALAYAEPSRPARPTSPAVAAIGTFVKAPSLVPDVAPRWRVWAGGYGGDATFRGDSTVGSHDLGVRNWGIAGGADYLVAPNAVLGVALAGGEASYRLGSIGSGRSESIQLGAYGSYRAGPGYVSAALAAGWHDLHTDRIVAIPGVTDRLLADFSGQAIGGRLETGWRLALPSDIGITPFAAIRTQAFRTPTYAETDATGLAAFALRYDQNRTVDTRSELGARFDALAWRSVDAALTLRGRLGWAHDYSTERSIAASFVTLGPASGFTVLGASAGRDAALVSAGAELKLSRGITLRGSFDGQFAGSAQVWSGMGSLSVAW
ncbi:MAG: autotransporter domain-containing protein [Rhodoplanes sp.]|uniref:autotransporter outer membrane beta-barrel domain-containing protein n=1 Tax=Rhodoplanes sp. TaxID=1968906 RepID=UPI0017EED579|nr:autotransporter domain-containing protein [Rhodoplanes sp.]NVO16656.1 autotransporter domain-containing protein [Rhodoplanes sp.]